ncbi:DEAD/DEAH box helicase [Flavobacterium cupreum]|uniref:DEAD/DEAH box helicase n=1 Tax=Flavobacterium cupreum TaxID=2133766 RepID=A0A434A2V8_9FLAO|nr:MULTISPECIES: DEAD/DEAH box helicase [Flavobacterium]RUT68654.1 DEAD/DEAH box helicase [Flavobacterium cupreum]TDO68779.1 SWI/SNF-related matrix-associated actin-dependent regulator 1 of chromatin subfamily A [Flavobacterium sp. P3160]
MQIVEFLNEFHISIDFGRWKDRNTQMVKGICIISEWSTNILTGQYIDNPTDVSMVINVKPDQINIPFEHLKNNQRIIWRKFKSVAKWNHSKKVWVVPILFKELVYKVGEKCKASTIQIKDNLPERVDVIPELPKLQLKLGIVNSITGHIPRPYQEDGIARGLELKRFINGDQPGLGKTLQSIGTVYAAEMQGEFTFPCIVICPSALKINWKREFEMWTDKKAMILDDKNKDTWHRFYEMGMADVFIVNYESLKKFFVLSMPGKKDLKHSSQILMDERIKIFKSAIVDESHRLKDPNSIQAKICIQITKAKKYIILLTGTPVVNKPIDLFSQLAVMFKLGHFGGENGFKARYCEGGKGSANLKELNYLMNMSCYFMRKKEDVLKDLPPLSRQTILCSLTNKKEFDIVRDDFANFLKNSDLTDSEIKKKVSSETIVKITMLLQISAKGKIEAAQEYIDEIVDSGQKIVVFCKHKIIVDLLKQLYPKAVTVTGNDDSIQKQNSVDSFQNKPDTKIIICNHKAAGVGLTLTASSEVLFVELPWTQADCEQAEARCHRMGQPSNVRATYLLGEDTLDQWLYDIIQEKKAIANAITGTEDIVPTSILSSVFDLFKK